MAATDKQGEILGKKLLDYAQHARGKPEIKPLTTAIEQAALDIARYRSHMQAVVDLDRGVQDVMHQIQELDQKRSAMLSQAHQMRDGVFLFTAEAREQAGILIHKHGLTQEEVNALAAVPEAIAAIRLDVLVPERIRVAHAAGTDSPVLAVTVDANGAAAGSQQPKA